MNEKNGYTPTQQKLLDALADGKPHPMRELRTLLEDCDESNLRMHMSNLRTKIRQAGTDDTIICEDGCYRRARYVSAFIS